MLEALSMTFVQHAIVAGVLASVACGVIGSLVVVNRQVFMAGGVAHAGYGGIGLAFYAGLPVIPTTVAFTVAASLCMGAAAYHRSERTDTLVGVLWATGMAVGMLLVDFTPGYNVDLMSYLFGSILTAPAQELWLMAGLVLVILATVAYWYEDFLAASFDRDFASATGAPVRMLHYLLLALTALSVVMIIRVVGLVLIIALLTIPPYLAEYKAPSLAAMMRRATLYALTFTMTGLALAYHLDTTSGPTIIAVSAASFFLVNAWRRIRSRRHRSVTLRRKEAP